MNFYSNDAQAEKLVSKYSHFFFHTPFQVQSIICSKGTHVLTSELFGISIVHPVSLDREVQNMNPEL